MSAARTPIAARRRRKPSATNRLRTYAFVIVCAVLLVIACTYAVVTWSGFLPKVSGVSGNTHVNSAAILRAAAIDDQRNLWMQSKHAMERRVEAIPYIDRAFVHRALPASVAIVVTERHPLAQVAGDRCAIVIDGAARVLDVRDGARPLSGLPLVAPARHDRPRPGVFLEEPVTLRALRDLERLAALQPPVRSLSFDRFDQLVVTTASGLRIEFGSDADLEKKAGLVGPILETVGNRLGKLAALDLSLIHI